MSWLKTGGRRMARRGLNFTHEVANSRLKEQIVPFRDKIQNALRVDAVDVIVFRKARLGLPCSCRKLPLTTELGDLLPDHSSTSESDGLKTSMVGLDRHSSKPSNSGITFDLGNSTIFGESSVEQKQPSARDRVQEYKGDVELGDLVPATAGNDDLGNPADFIETGFEAGFENCGICYREGFVPAFEAHNWKYQVMAHHNLTEIYGYSEDRSAKPLAFEQTDDDGFLEFSITVPKYFTEVYYSVRNNTDVYGAQQRLYDPSGTAIDKQYIDGFRGREMRVQVRDVPDFTHAVMMFRIIDEPVTANISEEQDMLNYENEVTVGDLTVIVPHTIGSIRSGDIIVAPKRNLVLKVTGAPRKSTADKQMWEWALTCRTLQRSESLHQIFKMFKVW